MPRIVIFDELATPQKVLGLTGPSVALTPYEGRTDVVIDPDLSALAVIDPATFSITSYIVPRKYWKVDTGVVVTMTAGEIAAQDAAESAAADLSTRTNAKGGLQNFNPSSLLLRAFADIVREEINILRSQHALPDRTLSQLRTAIDARIDDGTVDS